MKNNNQTKAELVFTEVQKKLNDLTIKTSIKVINSLEKDLFNPDIKPLSYSNLHLRKKIYKQLQEMKEKINAKKSNEFEINKTSSFLPKETGSIDLNYYPDGFDKITNSTREQCYEDFSSCINITTSSNYLKSSNKLGSKSLIVDIKGLDKSKEKKTDFIDMNQPQYNNLLTDINIFSTSEVIFGYKIKEFNKSGFDGNTLSKKIKNQDFTDILIDNKLEYLISKGSSEFVIENVYDPGETIDIKENRRLEGIKKPIVDVDKIISSLQNSLFSDDLEFEDAEGGVDVVDNNDLEHDNNIESCFF